MLSEWWSERLERRKERWAQMQMYQVPAFPGKKSYIALGSLGARQIGDKITTMEALATLYQTPSAGMGCACPQDTRLLPSSVKRMHTSSTALCVSEMSAFLRLNSGGSSLDHGKVQPPGCWKWSNTAGRQEIYALQVSAGGRASHFTSVTLWHFPFATTEERPRVGVRGRWLTSHSGSHGESRKN